MRQERRQPDDCDCVEFHADAELLSTIRPASTDRQTAKSQSSFRVSHSALHIELKRQSKDEYNQPNSRDASLSGLTISNCEDRRKAQHGECKHHHRIEAGPDSE